MAFIYMLHFDQRHFHAGHYCGCTESLRSRLESHALGDGARLTEVVKDLGIEWELSALWHTSHKNMRKMERKLKNYKKGPAYCPKCSGQQKPISGCTAYDVGLLAFPTNSKQLRELARMKKQAVVLDTAKLCEADNAGIRTIERHDKDALGFIPNSGESGLNILLKKEYVEVARVNGVIKAFLAYTKNHDGTRVRIQQTAVADELRLRGIGKSLVESVAAKHPESFLSCSVRNDLAANEFWTAIGFDSAGSHRHPTSHSLLNDYLKAAKGAKS